MTPAQVSVMIFLFPLAVDSFAQEASLVLFRRGDLPVILSAPHGGRTPLPHTPERDGGGTAKFETVRDENTEQLALKVAELLEEEVGKKVFLVIAQFERTYLDVNRHPASAYESPEAEPYYIEYHKALREACDEVRRKWGRGLLLDLHGQRTERSAIYRGTADGATTRKLVQQFGREALVGPRSILGQLAENGLTVLPANNSNEPEHPHFSGGYIVRTYGSHQETGIDAIQLEIGTKYRAENRWQRTASSLAAAIAVFAEEYLPKSRIQTEPSRQD